MMGGMRLGLWGEFEGFLVFGFWFFSFVGIG